MEILLPSSHWLLHLCRCGRALPPRAGPGSPRAQADPTAQPCPCLPLAGPEAQWSLSHPSLEALGWLLLICY